MPTDKIKMKTDTTIGNKLGKKDVWVEVEHQTPIDILDHVQDLRRYGEKQSGYFFTEQELEAILSKTFEAGTNWMYDAYCPEPDCKTFIDNLLK